MNNLINLYIKNHKYTLLQFQQDILDELEIESSISFGENDIEEYIEIYVDDDIIKVSPEGEFI